KGNDDNKLKSITVSKTNPDSTLISSKSLSGTSSTEQVEFFVRDLGAVTVLVSLTSTKDGASVTVTKSYAFTVVDASTPSTYTIDGDFPVLGNQVDAEPKFWSAKRKARFNLSDASGNGALQADLDFAYCTRSTGNKIISPASDDATAIYSD